MGGIVDRMTDTLMAHGCGDSDQCEKTARALLRDLLDPTDEMVEAGWHYTGDPCWQEGVVRAWQAMIRSAMGEGVVA